MVTLAARPSIVTRLLPDRVLGGMSVLMLAAVLAALARGEAVWNRLPPLLWAHLLALIVALAITPYMLVARQGTRMHRRLGYVWAGAMLIAAASSFGLRFLRHGLSPIHLLSAFMLVAVPYLIVSARRHDIRRHRNTVRGIVIGGLLIAGAATFPLGRMMGRMLLG